MEKGGDSDNYGSSLHQMQRRKLEACKSVPSQNHLGLKEISSATSNRSSIHGAHIRRQSSVSGLLSNGNSYKYLKNIKNVKEWERKVQTRR